MWQPEEASLQSLVELLNETQIPDDSKQKEIHQVKILVPQFHRVYF